MSAGFSQPPASTLTKALPARSALILHRGSHRTLRMRGCASVRAARVYVCAPVCLWGARVSARAGVWRGRALRPGGGQGSAARVAAGLAMLDAARDRAQSRSAVAGG